MASLKDALFQNDTFYGSPPVWAPSVYTDDYIANAIVMVDVARKSTWYDATLVHDHLVAKADNHRWKPADFANCYTPPGAGNDYVFEMARPSIDQPMDPELDTGFESLDCHLYPPRFGWLVEFLSDDDMSERLQSPFLAGHRDIFLTAIELSRRIAGEALTWLSMWHLFALCVPRPSNMRKTKTRRQKRHGAVVSGALGAMLVMADSSGNIIGDQLLRPIRADRRDDAGLAHLMFTTTAMAGMAALWTAHRTEGLKLSADALKERALEKEKASQ